MSSAKPDSISVCDAEADRLSEAGVSSARDILSEMSLSSLATQDECFRSARHSEGSFQKIEQYFKDGHLTDVVLIAGGKRIPAHRLVLSAVSEYFAAMFTNNLREATQTEIELQNVDGDALFALVLYCYNGKIELVEDTVETLLETACLLQLTEVINACCAYLKKQLHPSNCIGIRLFADAQGCIDLLNESQEYTSEHFMEVIKNQEFLLLPADEVVKLLASSDLNIPSEEAIFNAVVMWLEHDVPARANDVSRLLSYVKLPLLSPSFIVDHIESRALFNDDVECRKLMMEAFKFHLLPERRSSLQTMRTCPRKSTVGALFAVGGMDGNKGAVGIERYDCRKNEWILVANMIGRRLQFGVAVIDSRLFVVGGRDGLKTLNIFECFDVLTRTWTPLPPMATHRHGLGVCILGGPIYAVGGHDGWSYLNTVERYDPITRTWSYVAPMSTQRSTAGVAVLNGKLYAVGGRDGSACLKTVECYDPHTNRWSMCASMTKRRGGVGVGVANGFLYAVGGHDAPGLNPTATRFDCVERYDPQTDTWTLVASMSTGRDSVAVCLLGERLFALAGYDGISYLKLVEAYDPLTNEWQTMAPLNSERAGAGLVVIKLS